MNAKILSTAKAIVGAVALVAAVILATPLIPMPAWLHGALGAVVAIAGTLGIYNAPYTPLPGSTVAAGTTPLPQAPLVKE